MTITQSSTVLDVVLDAGRTFFNQKRTQIQTALAKRKVYHATHSELSALSDRDLQDLGILRGDINRLAREAAYGC